MATILSRLFFAGFVRLHVLYHAAEEPICGVRQVYRLSPGNAGHATLRFLLSGERTPVSAILD
jgi:hypothetical protein